MIRILACQVKSWFSELALLSTERFKKPHPLVGEDVVQGGDEDELLTLTSVHQAKGLEWKAVFIIWAAEGKFPSPKSLREIDSEEEERRLWYVALTRAKDELYLTYPLLVTDYNRQSVLQNRRDSLQSVPRHSTKFGISKKRTLPSPRPPSSCRRATNISTDFFSPPKSNHPISSPHLGC